METTLYNQQAKAVGTVELSDAVFRVPVSADLLHQVVVSQEANQRQNIAHTKGRGDVRGGGIKPWRQKGTGRARHGSIRSPIWKGGGVTHGPTKEENYGKKINKKMARAAFVMALSSKVADEQLAVVDRIELTAPKTREMATVLKALSGVFPKFRRTKTSSSSMLVAVPTVNDGSILRTTRNIPNVQVIEARNLNARTLLTRRFIVVLQDALKDLPVKQ